MKTLKEMTFVDKGHFGRTISRITQRMGRFYKK